MHTLRQLESGALAGATHVRLVNLGLTTFPPQLSALATHRQHLRHLRASHPQRSQSQCPRCGKPLVLRQRRGADAGSQPFLGCSACPRCRGTRQA